MKRTFAACLLSAALPLSSPLPAQDPPQPPEGSVPSSPPAGNSNDTGDGPNETPDSPVPPEPPCYECDKETGLYTIPVPNADGGSCPEGSQQTADVGSVYYNLGIGTTRYTTSGNYISRELGQRSPVFAYSRPDTGGKPAASAPLAADWKRGLIRPVVIGLARESVTADLFTPAALELYGNNAGAAWVKRDSAGALRQILSDQYLTDITVPAAGAVRVTVYLRSSIGALDSASGLYGVAGAVKFRQVDLTRPDPAALDTVDIATSDFTSSQTIPTVRGTRWTRGLPAGGGEQWTLTHHAGVPSSSPGLAKSALAYPGLDRTGLYVRTRTITRPATGGGPDVVHATVTEECRSLGQGLSRIVRRTEAPGTPEQLVTTYTYTDITGAATVGVDGTAGTPGPTPNLLLGGRLASLRRSDGYWEDYAYQYNAGTRTFLVRKWSPWLDSEPSDREGSLHTIITIDARSRSTVIKAADKTVSAETETLTVAADGTRTIRTERQTGTAGQPLVSEYVYYPDTAAEPSKGRIKSVLNSDGTRSTFTYTSVNDPVTPGATAVKTVTLTGAAAASGAITAGTRVETVSNVFDRVVKSETRDIASGLVLSQSLASAVDLLGRPTKVIHDADPADFEESAYACCGLENHRARDGSVTNYLRDALGRATATTMTLGSKTTVTTHNYGTAATGGRTLPKTTVTQTITAGAATATRTLSETVVNLRGQTLSATTPDSNGDGTPEQTTYAYDVAARTGAYTTPSGTTTSAYYADGRLKTTATLLGSIPVTPRTEYTHTTHDLRGGGVKSTVTTRRVPPVPPPGVLPQEDPTFPAPFSTHTYSDLAGRTFRTESPGYLGATLATETVFDTLGRPTGQTSTGKPATRRVLNALGETTQSWTDSNGDGSFNNDAVGGILDSVTLAETDWVTEDGLACRRVRQWVRDDSGADILLSTTYSSADGLYQKNVPLPGTGPVTTATATKPLDGNASSETRTYLGSDLLSPSLLSSVSTTQGADGMTTTTTTRKDTAGAVITTSTDIADLQGRPVSATGERGLATTYSDFTATGQPLGVTSQGTYTLTTLDTQGRVTKTVTKRTSDNAVIATVFTTYENTPSGDLLTRRWGTNTYPTLTRRDIQGRTTGLRTYQDIPAASLEAENLTLETSSGNPTTWAYEPATGLLLTKTDADTKSVTYTYTPGGKLLTRLWARGITTTYDYHSSGALKSIDYSDATPDVTLTYDRLGRRTAVSSLLSSVLQSSVSYTYDPATLALDKETITHPGGFTRILDRSQDALGRSSGYELKTENLTLETSSTYGYSETTGRLETVSGNSSGTFTYGYETNSSLIKTVTRPGLLETQPALRVTNTWEPARDVLLTKANELVLDNAVTDISSITYTMNALGQRTHATRTGAATNGTEWGYDTLGQIVSADDDTTAAHDRGYLYDSIGNRRGIRNGAVGVPLNGDGTIKENEGTLAYSANLLNQYNATPHATVPVHDDDGNMTSGDLQSGAGILPASLTWDAENRLTSVTVSGTTITYAYDAFSRRISRSVGVSPTSTTLYFYDAWNCIAEYQLQNSSFNLHTSYLWGLDLSGTPQGAGGGGGLLSVNCIGSPMAYPVYDGNGNITGYLGADGTVLAHFEYDPFGNTVASTDTTNQFEYRFSTKPIDPVAGLYYYGYRWYDPLTGRWPSRDPIGERGGLNLYCMLSNEVVNDVDVDGSESFKDYWERWKREHGGRRAGLIGGRDRNREGDLRRGCIGVTCINTGKRGWPQRDDSTHCFRTLKEATTQQTNPELVRQCKGKDCYGKNATLRIFAIHLNEDGTGFDPKAGANVRNKAGGIKGEVDLNNWDPSNFSHGNGTNGPGNFDFGYLNDDGTITHANHGEPGMDVHVSTLDKFRKAVNKKGRNGKYNVELWCVTCNNDEY